MTGIREMFSELSGEEPDWFQMAFWFERQVERQDEHHRDYRARRKFNPNMRGRYLERRRKHRRERHVLQYDAARQRKKYAMDPAYAEKRREAERQRYAAKKAARQAEQERRAA